MIRINNTQYFHFLQQADALRRSGLLCDAILTVKSETFRAHRLVLACASRRLEQQLALGDSESPVQCTLDHFSPHTFQQVLDFTYTQTLEVSMDDLHLLLRAAQLLEMQPLEDQCRKQLDNFHYRGRGNRITEIIQVKEEKEGAEQTDEDRRERPGTEEKLRDNSLPADEAYSIVMGNNSPLDPQKNYIIPPSPKKKSRVSPESAAPYSSERVLTSPAGSSSSFSSPWTFPNMWSSVSTLRRIAQNYSNLVAAYPRQHSNQSSAAYPFPLTSPHMLPLLGSHFQSPVMSYTGSHLGHTPNLYVGSKGMGSIIRQGLLKRKRQSQRLFNTTVQSSELNYHDVSKANTGRVKRCQHCSTSIVDDPAPQESSSTPSGEACARYNFTGDDAARHEPKSHQQEQRGGKPFQCQYCPKKFSLKHQLDTHHRVHTGEKPFQCRICGQRSRDYSAMIKHLRTHGGAAPYQCTVCLEFCSSLVAMQRHIKSHTEQDFPPDWSISSTYLYTSHI